MNNHTFQPALDWERTLLEFLAFFAFFLTKRWYLSFRLVWYRRIVFLQNSGDRNIAIRLFSEKKSTII